VLRALQGAPIPQGEEEIEPIAVSKTDDTGEKLQFLPWGCLIADEQQHQVIDIFGTILRASKP
jgi:hypothetical protein